MSNQNFEKLKPFLRQYMETLEQDKSGKKCVCPCCGSGSGVHGTSALGITPNTNDTKWKCHACGVGGDIVDLYQAVNNCERGEAIKELNEMYGDSTYTPPKETPLKEEKPPTDYTDFFIEAQKHLNETDYLTKRGISEETQKKFEVGYIAAWRDPEKPKAPLTPRIIIPTSDYTYFARDTRPDETIPDYQKPYAKYKVGGVHMLKPENLYDENSDYCFVVEGEIDCMSIDQCGYNCIGLGSTSMMHKLLDECKKKKPHGILIFAMDKDHGGEKALKQVPKFRKEGIPCIIADVLGDNLPDGVKDPNDLLRVEPERLKANLQKTVEQAREEQAKQLALEKENPKQNKKQPIKIIRSESSASSLSFEPKFYTDTLTIEKLELYLEEKGITVKYNDITHRIEYNEIEGISYDHLRENIPTLIYNELHDLYKKCTRDNIIHYLSTISTKTINIYNPILETIQGTKWDGKSRLEEVYKMFRIDENNESDELSRIIMRKWFMQCICGLHNNSKNPFSLDIILVFQGEQGTGKTRFFEHLAMNNNYFGEGVTIDTRNKDSLIEATSNWICELGEIGSTMKKDIDSLKAFLTRSTDVYRVPYGVESLSYPRKTSFCGTTNDKQFLIDETGNRRFAPIPLKSGMYIDIKQIKKFDTLQFWAEINQIVEEEVKKEDVTYGSCFRLTREELQKLNKRNLEFQKPLKGEEEVLDILAEQSTPEQGYELTQKYMTVTEFKQLHSALQKYTSVQIGKVLEKYGYTQKKVSINNSSTKVRLLPCKKYTGYTV